MPLRLRQFEQHHWELLAQIYPNPDLNTDKIAKMIGCTTKTLKKAADAKGLTRPNCYEVLKRAHKRGEIDTHKRYNKNEDMRLFHVHIEDLGFNCVKRTNLTFLEKR